jgi:hypothetical protein
VDHIRGRVQGLEAAQGLVNAEPKSGMCSEGEAVRSQVLAVVVRKVLGADDAMHLRKMGWDRPGRYGARPTSVSINSCTLRLRRPQHVI